MITRIQQHFIFIFFFSFISLTHSYAKYYVSSSTGHDDNSGMIKNSPFKSLEKLNAMHFKPGDTIFFKSGDVFYGTLQLNDGGNEGKNLVLTSYGNGPKPIFTGSSPIIKKASREGLMFSKQEKKIYAVFVNNKLQLPARYPNNEFLHFDDGGRNYMIDYDLKKHDINPLSSTIRMRIKNWSYENKRVESIQDDTVYFDRNLWHNNHEKYTCEKGWGYFFDNKKEFISNKFDWAYHPGDESFYILNPNDEKIEITQVQYGIIVNKNVSHITFNNLDFRKYYKAGLLLKKETNNITIANCSFINNFLRGIECKENSNHIQISGCLVMDILGQGISIIEGNNYLIENNEVKRIGLHAGYGIDGNNGGMGIIITNNEIRPEGYSFISHQNIIRKNRIDSVGNYAIRMDGSNSICEYNIVSNGLLTFNDGALIYCWGMDSTFTNHNIIRNNIVSRSHGNLSGSPKKQLINVGIYIDNNVNNVVVENNTISKTQIGILLNSLSYNNKATNNILFDNTYGISLSEYHPGHPIFGTEIKNNTIVGINYNQRTFFLKSYVHKSMNPGIIDDNISYNPKVEFLINYLTTYESFRRKEEMSFYEWQKRGFDINGKHIEANTNLEHKKQPEHLINFGISPKVVDLPKYNYSDFSGKKIESIKIPPYSSVVVLRSYHP